VSASRQELAELLRERERRKPAKTFLSLEHLLTTRELFGLETATPLQRAICRIADAQSIGDLADNEGVRDAIGDFDKLVVGKKPKELFILSGIRVGKSLFAALLAIYWSQTCDVSKLGPGEIPRVSIISVDRDKAQVVFDHLKGRVLASAQLSKLLVEEPLKDSLRLRHPTGLPIEIMVIAGSKAGSAVVSRWSAGVIFDEFPRMEGEGEAAVNWDETRASAMDRLLPGAQMLHIGSPWAPTGPAYEVVTSRHGLPGEDLVVVKTPAWTLNPFFWTPEKIEESKKNPDIYQTECLGEFRSPEEAMFTMSEVEGSIRATPPQLPYQPHLSYRAAMDPATRGNGWTLIITTRVGRKKKVAVAREWVGSKVAPVSVVETVKEIAKLCAEYKITSIDSDQYMGDALKEIAGGAGLHVRLVSWTEKQKLDKYLALKTRFALGEIEIPNDKLVRADLLQVKKRTTTNGIKVILPKTSDGRHCDYMPSLVLALGSYLDDAAADESLTDEQKVLREAERMKKDRFATVKAQQERSLRGRVWSR
jgi:hypothetical protein